MTTKARALANLLSQGNIFADSQVAASEITGLHTVATTGSYADLVNKPTVVSHFTNDANYASTTYVNTQVSNLVASAPAALDTLNELASALGNDASFSATTATALGNRLRVDTAAQSLSSTQKTNAKTNLDLQNVENKSSATIRGELTSSNVTTALGFTPYNATNPNAYISGNQTITFSGDATGSGAVTVALTLANSGVTAGTYGSSTNIPQLVVDAKGRVTSVSNVAVSIPSGALTFTGDVTGSGSTGSSTALTLANSGVTAGTYTKVTVDAKGRVTVGATLASADLPTYTGSLTSAQVTGALGFTPYNSTNPSGYINGNQTITFSGDATGSGTTSVALTLANSGVTAGTYTRVTVDGKGRVTAASAPTDTAIFDVNVNTSTYWTITRPNGSALSGNIVYRITLVTLGTGTDTGEVYLVSNPDGAGWQLKAVTKTASGSNYPYVFLDSGIPKVKSDHASLYTTRVLVEEFNGGNSGTLPSAFGLDAFFTHDVNAAKYRSSWNGSDNILLHAGNYNSYSPTLTGSGASGTWGISITGSAATLGGKPAQDAVGANTIPTRDGSGYTYFNYINSNTGNSENPSVSQVIVTNGSDGFYRKASIAHLTSAVQSNASGTWGINVTAASGRVTYQGNRSAETGTTVSTPGSSMDVVGAYSNGYPESFGNVLSINGGGSSQLYMGWVGGSGAETGELYYRSMTDWRTNWGSWRRVLTNANYTSYSPSLTGSGASGTWGISISGNAATASRVTSGNLTPASTSFNNALIPASGSTRVLTFDGNGSLPSVWWSNGTRAYGAIDAIDPGLAFWANNGSSWQQQMTVNYGNVTINTDIRTPILYDSNDTGYYLNPNSSSRLSSTYTDNSYTYGWFRNYNQNGLYNETHGNHWYATGNNYWNLAGNNTTHVGIILRTSGHQGTVRGYVYADNNNSIGFLNSNGSWRFRVVGDDYSLADGSSMRAPLFYDSNDTTYYIDPASTSVLVSGYIFRNFLRRETTTHSGISWYSPSYTAWCNYMSPAGAGSSGPTGNITAPSGTYVNSWALRSFIENASGYGWTFESGTSSGQPSVVAEIRASDGLARFSGGTYSPNFYDSNDTGYYLDPNSTSRLNYVVPNRIKLVSQVNNEPRWDFSAYVVEAQHWYGNNGSQTMYLGESNWINIRNTADIHGDARSPIYYDRNDTGYYLDPNANTALRTVGSWRADSATWDGEFAGKIQYHSSNWYIQYSGNAIFRNSGGSNIMTCDSSGNVTFSGNVTAYSDRNKKTNITTLTTAQQYFDKIDAKNYVWKDTGKEDIGFVAQDVEAAGLHMFVHNNEVHDPNTGEVVETIKSLDYGRMVAVLWQTVKELKQELDALKSKQ